MNSEPKFQILVRLAVSSEGIRALVWPASNHIGTYLLGRMLVHALERNQVKLHSYDFRLELNRATGFLIVNDRVHAMEIIKDELNAVHLLPDATICWQDTAEDCWRTFYPAQGSLGSVPTQALAAHQELADLIFGSGNIAAMLLAAEAEEKARQQPPSTGAETPPEKS